MGVLGLTPFLLKVCPEVVKELPHRLKSLSGTRIAIDATLMTHRFHWANVNHERRHVLGWWRLLSELRENNIQAIAVFDSKERSEVKQPETLRRRGLQLLSSRRGTMEFARYRRLRQLNNLITRLSVLPPESRGIILEWLRKAPPLDDLDLDSSRLSIPAFSPKPPPKQSYSPSFKKPDAWIPSLTRALPLDNPSTSLSLPEELESLYDSYRQITPLTTTIAPVERKPNNNNPPSTPIEADDAETHLELSRTQHQLTLDEGQVWSALSSSSTSDAFLSILDKLSHLTDQSDTLWKSYQKRAFGPTDGVYAESRVMIEAMGVPWVECPPPFEAEGFASSLVLHGKADFVISEDTDVLVYGAPLLRNITPRTGGVTLTYPKDIHAGLGLDEETFRDFCLLLGTDFTTRMRLLGPRRALGLLKVHGSIEAIMDAGSGIASGTGTGTGGTVGGKKREKFKFSPEPRVSVEEYLEEVRVARMVYTTLPLLSALEGEVFEPRRGPYDAKAVREVLDQYDLSSGWLHNYDGGEGSGGGLDVDFFAIAGEGEEGGGDRTRSDWEAVYRDDPRMHT